jgi:hypothetical protein
MQNEVFNRRLFQRKDGARTRLNQLARADQPSGILASSQPLIDEAMKSVRRPETSAIPMDVAKGMSAGRAGGMPMAPAPMPMPMAPPPAPMPMAPPPQQMAQAPQPQPNLNPMRPGVRTMALGGETIPGFDSLFRSAATQERMAKAKEEGDARRAAVAQLPGGPQRTLTPEARVRVQERAGTVAGTEEKLPDTSVFTAEQMAQYAEIMADTEMSPKEKVTALDVLAGGDPDAKDRKASVDDTLKKNKLGKINRKASFPKILTDINKMVESKAGFDIAKSANPRAAVAFAEGMSGAAETVLGLEADKQKTAAANAEAERLLRLKASLTPRTGAGGAFSKADGYTDTVTRMTVEIMKTQDLPYNEALAFAQQHAQSIGLTPGGAPSGGGAGSPPSINTQEEFDALPSGSEYYDGDTLLKKP